MTDKIYILLRWEEITSGLGQCDPVIVDVHPECFYDKHTATQACLTIAATSGGAWSVKILTLKK